jgi:hypothetical protein
MMRRHLPELRRDVVIMILPEFVMYYDRRYPEQDDAQPRNYIVKDFSHSRFVFIVWPMPGGLSKCFQSPVFRRPPVRGKDFPVSIIREFLISAAGNNSQKISFTVHFSVAIVR